jgi:hypothetical protein
MPIAVPTCSKHHRRCFSCCPSSRGQGLQHSAADVAADRPVAATTSAAAAAAAAAFCPLPNLPPAAHTPKPHDVQRCGCNHPAARSHARDDVTVSLQGQLLQQRVDSHVTRHPQHVTRHLMLHVVQQQHTLGGDVQPLALRTVGQIGNNAVPLRNPSSSTSKEQAHVRVVQDTKRLPASSSPAPPSSTNSLDLPQLPTWVQTNICVSHTLIHPSPLADTI